MTTCICTVGYPGAGKTAAQTPAQERDIPVVVMGNRVRERALDAIPDEKLANAGEDAGHSKSDLIGEWATEQREKYGDDIVAKWTVEYIKENVESDVVFVDGMRSTDERDVFEEGFDNVVVLYVEAPFQTRLERLRNRGRDGEEEFTEADLQKRDEREDEWGVSEVVAEADFTVSNDGSLEDLHDVVRSVLDEV